MIWLIILLNTGLAGGWARWIAVRTDTQPRWLLTITLMIALHTAVLSWLMLMLGLIGVPLRGAIITAIYTVLMLVGWVGLLIDRRQPMPLPVPVSPALDRRVRWYLLLLVAGIAGAVLFNAVMFPFYRDDTLGIYVPFAQEIAETQALVPITAERNLYELYPQHMSMTYAYVFLMSGWENPYPGLVLNALLSLGTLGATYLLAYRLLGGYVAWAAVLILALTPDFGNWASAGYVDLPMALYYTLAVFFAWRTTQSGQWIDALLAGLMIGCAVWTKNAALLAIGLLMLYWFLHLILRQITVNNILLSSISIGVVAVPWYLRNLFLAGMLTPDTVWVEDAQQTLREVLILITLPQNYGVLGWVMLAGGVYSGWRIVSGSERLPSTLLIGASLPYFLMWFAFASYDPRFILLFIPLLAIMGGRVVIELGQHIKRNQTALSVGIGVLIGILALSAMWNSVDYKRALLTERDLSHPAKLKIVRHR